MFAQDKRYYIDRRLAERMAATASPSFSTYFAALRANAENEIEHLINSFTVNETYFYREDHQFRCLTSTLLEVIAPKKHPGEPIRIWSVPCSTGEEPYSIAIWLLENWERVDKFEIEIIGLPPGLPPSTDFRVLPRTSAARALSPLTLSPAPGTNRPTAPPFGNGSPGGTTTTATGPAACAAPAVVPMTTRRTARRFRASL